MSDNLTKFLTALEKKDLLNVLKSVAKFPKAEELINELKNRGLKVNTEIAEELCSQFTFPIEQKDLESIFGGCTSEMDELDWAYFSQHPEYGVTCSR